MTESDTFFRLAIVELLYMFSPTPLHLFANSSTCFSLKVPTFEAFSPDV